MRFMIFDETGNAIDAFDEYFDAVAEFEGLVRTDPSMVRDIALLTFDEAGNAVGEPEVAADIPAIADYAGRVEVDASSSWSQLGPRTFVGRWLDVRIGNEPSLSPSPGLAAA